MPAVSKRQRRAIAIAEHHPEELYPENRGLAEMSHKQMHEFATTSERELPTTVRAKKKEVKRGYASDKKYQHDTGRHIRGRGVR